MKENFELQIQKLKQLYHESLAAQDAANESSHTKSQFLAQFSHEIRTPVSAILGYADLLSEEDCAFEQDELSNRIRANGEQLLRLVDDILNLAKYEAGTVPLVKEVFSVRNCIEECLKGFKSACTAKNIELIYEQCLITNGLAFTDRGRFLQVVNNLLNNALKFTDCGRIKIRLSDVNGFKVEVKDEGIGISEAGQKNLFKPFSQADQTIAGRFGGTGLGLVISKKIANALGGDLILAESSPGKGSTFWFSFDAGEVPSDVALTGAIAYSSASRNLRSSHQLHGLNLLLADDCYDNQQLVKYYLEREGAVVQLANNGNEAIQLARNERFDLVLMDIQMTELDGLEATRQLRASGYGVPIIALSAHAMAEEVAKSIRAGCNAHLIKPISRRDLIKEIRSQLRISHADRQFESLH